MSKAERVGGLGQSREKTARRILCLPFTLQPQMRTPRRVLLRWLRLVHQTQRPHLQSQPTGMGRHSVLVFAVRDASWHRHDFWGFNRSRHPNGPSVGRDRYRLLEVAAAIATCRDKHCSGCSRGDAFGPLIHCINHCMITARIGCLLWKSNLREMQSDGQVVDFKLAEREGTSA